MQEQCSEALRKERQVLIRIIKLQMWAGLPLAFVIFGTISFLSRRYLNLHFGIFDWLPIMLGIWGLEIGPRVYRLRRITKVLNESHSLQSTN